jgi:carbonic anhydrase
MVLSAATALERLKAGNRRYVTGRLHSKKYAEERERLVRGQRPYAIVLGCADSRVSPEIIFDESLGRLFVVRVAGNVASPEILGSIEYAAERLGVRLLLVLGHDSCGAVAVSVHGGKVPRNVTSLAERISPAVRRLKGRHQNPEKLLDAATTENVRLQIRQALAQSKVLKDLVAKRKLRVVGGLYKLHTGEVEFRLTRQ